MDNRILKDILLSELEEIKRYCYLENIAYFKGEYVSIINITRKLGLVLDEELHAKINDVWKHINYKLEENDNEEI